MRQITHKFPLVPPLIARLSDYYTSARTMFSVIDWKWFVCLQKVLQNVCIVSATAGKSVNEKQKAIHFQLLLVTVVVTPKINHDRKALKIVFPFSSYSRSIIFFEKYLSYSKFE